MNGTPAKLIAMVAGVAVVAAAGGYWIAQRSAHMATDARPASAEGTRGDVLYWYDPMAPNQHFDKPGKSPFMDMQLVPKYADSTPAATVRIEPGVLQNLGVRLTTVERAVVPNTVDAVGSVLFNQRNVAVVQTRATGFVVRVYARAPGDLLARGAPLVDLLVPEWSGAQAEYLALIESGDPKLAEAAGERLALLGIPRELVARAEAGRQIQTTFTIRTPIAGVIAALEVREGMTMASGATIAKINGLESVWVEAAMPEASSNVASLGESAEVRLGAYPVDVFKGRLIAVLPEANSETRTLRVRVEVPNPDGRLRPGMFAQVRLESGAALPLLYVASEAIVRTGTRSIVLLADERGSFTPVEVRPGAEANGKTVILEGLSEGEKVVASGQFLIDSEANLKGALRRFEDAATQPEAVETAP